MWWIRDSESSRDQVRADQGGDGSVGKCQWGKWEWGEMGMGENGNGGK